MDLANAKYRHVYAVVRYDAPITPQNFLDAVTVLKVFASARAAEIEAARLRSINGSDKCLYQVQITRLAEETQG